MQRAAHAFVGTHDFRAVRSVGTETRTTVRTVHWCEVTQEDDIITLACRRISVQHGPRHCGHLCVRLPWEAGA